MEPARLQAVSNAMALRVQQKAVARAANSPNRDSIIYQANAKNFLSYGILTEKAILFN
jgi:hypothetical protein